MSLSDLIPAGLRKKTIVPVVIILLVSMTCVTAFNYYSQVSILKTDAEESVTSAINTTHGFIASHLNLYQQMATLLASNPTVIDAVSRNDRSKLTAEYLQSYEALKKRIQLNQLNFHRPPGVALLRLQDLERYGDNLAEVRHTISDVYKNKAAVKGLEFGRTGLGLRGIEPVFSKGTFVGSLEFGGDLAPALDEAKQAYGVDCGIVITKAATSVANVMPEKQGTAKAIGEYLSFYSTNQNLTMGVVTASMLERAKAEGSATYMDSGGFQGKDYSIGIAPLKDYSGNIIGYLYVMKDRTVVLGKIYKSLAINVIVFLIVLSAVVYAISNSINRTVVEPVVRLATSASEISKGKVSDKIQIETGDEIETLAKSIDRLRVSMKMFLE